MTFLNRLWTTIQGKRDALLDRMEDPEEQLSVFVNELNEQVQSLHRSVAGAIADEKRLKMQIEEHLAKASEWENRAVLALQEGREELAREAVIRKEECEAQALAIQKGWEGQKEATEKLKASLQAAKQRVSDAKTKYTLLLAQYKSVTTKKKIQESLSVRTGDSPMLLMDRLSDKIRNIEAETEANMELAGENTDDDLEGKFVQLEKQQKGDHALELLKAKMAERKQLGSGPPQGNRIDELKAKLDNA